MISLVIRFTLSAIVVVGMMHLSAAMKQMQNRTQVENTQIACISDPRCTSPQ